ncbi:MAG: hypothetical protein J7497_10410 [Chitinophagaceae bacterium]|nr:hypothetical protein [Chitinophagaceae bacterium]
MTDQYTYGTWIARFMGNKASKRERAQLSEWIAASPENMELFEDLIYENNANWAREWFRNAGVKTGFIKWKDSENWPEQEDNSTKGIGLWVALTAAMLAGIMVWSKFNARPDQEIITTPVNKQYIPKPMLKGIDAVKLKDTVVRKELIQHPEKP